MPDPGPGSQGKPAKNAEFTRVFNRVGKFVNFPEFSARGPTRAYAWSALEGTSTASTRLNREGGRSSMACRVLIVEDEPLWAATLEDMLNDAGHSVCAKATN